MAKEIGFTYPEWYIELLWDNKNMKGANFDDMNQFIKRVIHEGFDVKL